MIDTVGARMGAELDAETGAWDFSKNNNAAEERFAEAFERYVMEGVAPTKKLRGVFGTLASFMRRIYQGVTEGPMAVRASPEMKESSTSWSSVAISLTFLLARPKTR